MIAFSESSIEEATLAWLESVGWQVRNGAEIAPNEPAAERDDCDRVLLARLGGRACHATPPRGMGGCRMNSADTIPGGEVLVYEAPDGGVRVEVKLDRDTVWLTQRQMSDLFETTPGRQAAGAASW
ncbi:MAG: hypothetical protein KJZ83_09850 [Burkholderiaceae bacterium]|nr:hypothetical protein [Burkholderiaceae bacterium]